MKEKLLSLTQKLTEAGFLIEGIEVESRDMVRIKFQKVDGLELIVNGSSAKIEAGKCTKIQLAKLKEILKKDYTIKDKLESLEEDMFSKLLNAS